MATLVENYLKNIPKDKQSSAAIAYLASLDHLTVVAPEIKENILQELRDQRSFLKLIASENYSSLAVQLSMGNLLTDKYAEGFPRHRFYAGCDNVDNIEELAVKELVELFGCDHGFVQPHCGADANMIALWSVLIQRVQNKEIERLGKKTLEELTPAEYEEIRQLMLAQKLMGMSLDSGGHLTHGYRHNVSSKMMQAVCYDVDPATGLLNYDTILEMAKKEKPLVLMAGYSSYPRRINFAKMRAIADEVGAVLMADMAHFSGLVAGKVLTGEYDPVPYADFVTSTTHKTLRGPRGGLVMCKKEFAETLDKACPLFMGGPLPHVIAAKAIAFREANRPEFRAYAQQIVNNAVALAERLKERGIALLTDGTENHLIILDVSKVGLTGRQAEKALREAGMTVNRNTIPNDPNGRWYTSGIRIGTPALTTLGMKEAEMREVGDLLADVLFHTKAAVTENGTTTSKAKYVSDAAVVEGAQQRIKKLLQRFPLYPEIVIDFTSL